MVLSIMFISRIITVNIINVGRLMNNSSNPCTYYICPIVKLYVNCIIDYNFVLCH